jgi:5'-nucleotidase
MSSRRRVLVTNDDGIHAPGLRALARMAVGADFDVVVAAPDYEASGSSAALTAIYRERRLAVTRTDFAGNPDVEAYAVAASPGYISMLATIGAFGRRPDLVLSGINRGANTGHAVLHSGTVGAALTAANYGIAAMAVSLDVLPTEDGGESLAEYFGRIDNEALHWDAAASVAAHFLSIVDKQAIGTVLNVNVPNRLPASLAGVRQATLAAFGHVQMAVAEAGEGYLRTTVERTGDRTQPGTDVAMLSQGYATVTVLTTVRAEEAPLDLGPVHASLSG